MTSLEIGPSNEFKPKEKLPRGGRVMKPPTVFHAGHR